MKESHLFPTHQPAHKKPLKPVHFSAVPSHTTTKHAGLRGFAKGHMMLPRVRPLASKVVFSTIPSQTTAKHIAFNVVFGLRCPVCKGHVMLLELKEAIRELGF